MVYLLFCILSGSLLTALWSAIHGASWGGIALAYIGGGWIGLIAGIAVMLLAARRMPAKDLPSL